MRRLVAGKSRRRGGLMFEFALLLPLVVFLISFTIDMGRLVSLNSTLHDSTAVAARAGARQGFAGHIPGGQLCGSRISTGANPSYEAFCEAFRPLDGVKLVSVELLSPSPDGVDRWCSRTSESNLYVTVRARANLNFITPGIENVIAAAQGGQDVVAVGLARCEVAR
jgi:hypothetical protein